MTERTDIGSFIPLLPLVSWYISKLHIPLVPSSPEQYPKMLDHVPILDAFEILFDPFREPEGYTPDGILRVCSDFEG